VIFVLGPQRQLYRLVGFLDLSGWWGLIVMNGYDVSVVLNDFECSASRR
jgi:hypothetical protein